MPDSATLVLYLVTTAATIIAPGPGVLLNLTESLRHGFSRAWPVFIGTAAGNAAMSFLTMAGLGTLLMANPGLFLLVQAAGGLYLAWLAVQNFRAPPMNLLSLAERAEASGGEGLKLFVRGLALQATNPLLILFLFSLFPQFIDPGHPFWPQVSLLVAIFVALTVAIHSGYSLLATYARHLLARSATAGVWVNRVCGALFLFFAASILLKVASGLLG